MNIQSTTSQDMMRLFFTEFVQMAENYDYCPTLPPEWDFNYNKLKKRNTTFRNLESIKLKATISSGGSKTWIFAEWNFWSHIWEKKSVC